MAKLYKMAKSVFPWPAHFKNGQMKFFEIDHEMAHLHSCGNPSVLLQSNLQLHLLHQQDLTFLWEFLYWQWVFFFVFVFCGALQLVGYVAPWQWVGLCFNSLSHKIVCELLVTTLVCVICFGFLWELISQLNELSWTCVTRFRYHQGEAQAIRLLSSPEGQQFRANYTSNLDKMAPIWRG